MKIRWAEHGKRSYEAVLDDLIERGKKNKAVDLMDCVDQILELLARLPLMFPTVSSLQNVRKVILNRDLNLYYLFEGK